MAKTARKITAEVIDIRAHRGEKASRVSKNTAAVATTAAKPAKPTKPAAAAPAKPVKATKTAPAVAAKAPVAKAPKAAPPVVAAKAPKAAAKTTKPVIRTATLVGAVGQPKAPRAAKGNFLFVVGKSIAEQAITTTEVATLPGKLPAAAKQLIAEGGIVTKTAAKTAGLDFAALTAKVSESRRVHVIAKATVLTVTPHADKANIALASADAKTVAKLAPKAVKAAPVVGIKAPTAKAPKAALVVAAKPAKAGKVTVAEAAPAKPRRAK